MSDEFQYFGKYIGQLSTYTLHKRSGDIIRTDAPVDNNGEGRHFSPTDLLANALGTCILTVMGMKADQQKINMDGATFEIKKVMDSNPRRISEVHVRIHMPEIAYDSLQKKILEAAARHCPVANSLHPDIVENIEIMWCDPK